MQAKSDAGFVFMASNGGFAEKQGLKIEMMQFTGDALALKALLAGELDSYEGSPGGPMLAASQGADIKLARLLLAGPHLRHLCQNRRSRAPKDLKGKSIAISAPGALPDLLARAVLEQNNISASDVRFAVMGSDSDRYRAVTVGKVDAAAASTEFVPLAERCRREAPGACARRGAELSALLQLVGGKTLAQRNADVVAFLAAEIAALRYAMANRDKMIELATEDERGQARRSARGLHLRRGQEVFGDRSGDAGPDGQARLDARAAGQDRQPDQAGRLASWSTAAPARRRWPWWGSNSR